MSLDVEVVVPLFLKTLNFLQNVVFVVLINRRAVNNKSLSPSKLLVKRILLEGEFLQVLRVFIISADPKRVITSLSL